MYNGFKVFDFHCHIFPDAIAQKASAAIGEYYKLPVEHIGCMGELLTSANAAGVERLLIHSTATRPEQTASINNYLAGLLKANPSRLTAFGTLHPLMERSEMDAEIKRLQTLGLKGVKVHADFQGYDIDHPLMMKMYELLEGKLPVLMHVGDENTRGSKPNLVGKALDAFPGLVVIAAHLGGYSDWDEAERTIVGRGLYLDTSSALHSVPPERAAAIIRAHGTDKILFGTDFPLVGHTSELERFFRLGLTDDERSAILFDNAARLLNE